MSLLKRILNRLSKGASPPIDKPPIIEEKENDVNHADNDEDNIEVVKYTIKKVKKVK